MISQAQPVRLPAPARQTTRGCRIIVFPPYNFSLDSSMHRSIVTTGGVSSNPRRKVTMALGTPVPNPRAQLLGALQHAVTASGAVDPVAVGRLVVDHLRDYLGV